MSVKHETSEDYKRLYPRGGGPLKRAPQGYYTASQAADKLHTNTTTLAKWRIKGYLPYYKAPLHSDGWYPCDAIDAIASQTERRQGSNVSLYRDSIELNKENISLLVTFARTLEHLQGQNLMTPSQFQSIAGVGLEEFRSTLHEEIEHMLELVKEADLSAAST